MGISYMHGQVQLFQEACKQERIVLPGLRMAELGNQWFHHHALPNEEPAKAIFELFGVRHISFDTNGKDGALPLDLSCPLPEEYRGQFDMVTNFGTSEHVANSQYLCWKNIHDLCAPAAWMIHGIPEVGSWPGHGVFHYTLPRVLRLAEHANYEVCIARRFKFQETFGERRLKHCLLLCFRRGGDGFPGVEQFQDIMFPKGEPWF